MNKYLITGYSGFVSQHFLDYLESLKEPCQVLGVDINFPIIEQNNYQYIECNFQQLNLLEKEQVNQLLNDFRPDYILHLASYSSVAYSWENPVSAFVNNLNIFLNLVDQVRLAKLPCRMLSVGSSEEYGNVSEDLLPLKEEIPTNPISPYAVARVSQEMLSKIYANSYGVDIVLTRSFNHIGPGQKEMFVISSFAKKLVNLKISQNQAQEITVGNIEVIRDFVDVRDVAKAYYLLLQEGKKGEIYNICSGTGHSLKEILQQMMNILGLDINVVTDPKLIRPDDNKIIVGSNDKIFRDINWKPTITIDKSLRDIISYWTKKLNSLED